MPSVRTKKTATPFNQTAHPLTATIDPVKQTIHVDHFKVKAGKGKFVTHSYEMIDTDTHVPTHMMTFTQEGAQTIGEIVVYTPSQEGPTEPQLAQNKKDIAQPVRYIINGSQHETMQTFVRNMGMDSLPLRKQDVEMSYS